MAQMNYPHAPDGCQPGERVLFNALKRNLPDEYFVWYEPTLFGRRNSSRPDFVVLGSDIGLVIIEVKDWSIDKIHRANRDIFQLFTGSTVETRTNPEKQAERQKRALWAEIERYRRTDPDKHRLLRQTNGQFAGKLAVSIEYLVAFPNITRHEWHTAELRLFDMINEPVVLFKVTCPRLSPSCSDAAPAQSDWSRNCGSGASLVHQPKRG